ncbi:MAG: hypothetical protein CMP57_04375 [Flavobacteriales bacterium]|nr:hypothetical protein [Flavobacteriales bacterium]
MNLKKDVLIDQGLIFRSFLFRLISSENSRRKIEKLTLFLALASFLVHLTLIYLFKYGLIDLPIESNLFSNPISAIYTPFSFILLYEVYLLVYYLPKSFTSYLTKQYEIISLIIIRRLFKDLSVLEFSSDWFKISQDLQFTYDLVASIILFYLIYLFTQKSRRIKKTSSQDSELVNFIKMKKIIATLLVPIFFFLASYTLYTWVNGFFFSPNIAPLSSLNNLFFDEFFTILILVDVVLLLLSFFYTDKFHKIIRNSGFIISTILLRMSFGVTGLISTILIVAAVLYGLIIITVHNKYELQQDKD